MYCPSCGREVKRKNYEFNGVYFCQPSCKTKWLVSTSDSNTTNKESDSSYNDDKKWDSDGSYTEAMWKAMK